MELVYRLPTLLLLLITINIDDHNVDAEADGAVSGVRVASFNVKQFGATYVSRERAVENLVKIFQRYDLVFVMETRDSSEGSIRNLWERLGFDEWEFVASEPVGRSPYYKEQYVYFYRPEVVKFISANLYDDSASDVFEREPFIAQFQYLSQAAGSEVKVTFVGIHVDPDDVQAELEGLPAVIVEANKLYGDSGGIITMGDFNADCDYMSCSKRETATVFSTPEVYTSYIPHKADTTVSHNTHCAYDRVVLSQGQGQPKAKVTNVTVFNFEVELGLTYEDAQDVSDHYPVEFYLA